MRTIALIPLFGLIERFDIDTSPKKRQSSGPLFRIELYPFGRLTASPKTKPCTQPKPGRELARPNTKLLP